MNDEDFFDRVKKIPAENRGLFLALVAAYVAGIESSMNNRSRKHRKANVEESEDDNNERSNDVIS